MSTTQQADQTKRTPLLVLAWLWVSLPFAYGVYQLIFEAIKLFQG